MELAGFAKRNRLNEILAACETFGFHDSNVRMSSLSQTSRVLGVMCVWS